MARNILFLVHGMGRNFAAPAQHDPAWSDAVVHALDAAWAMFPALAGIRREDVLELVPITYDHVFRDYLQDVSDHATRLARFLPDGVVRDVFDVIESADPEEENFFWDHICDVLDYRYGADRARLVHVEIAKAIMQKREEVLRRPDHQNATYSVLCHSLGTAATHGALNRLGGGNIGSSAAYRLGGDFRIRTYMSLANVSRVLWYGELDIYQGTIVRPFTHDRGRGYVDHFINVSHIIDPVPAPFRFEPSDWGGSYELIELRHLRDVNVHGFTHYLQHPQVAGKLFRSILGNAFLTRRDVAEAAADYPDLLIQNPVKRERAAQLVTALATSLHETYADDAVPLASTAKLMARAIHDLWKHRKSVADVLASV